MYDNNRREVLSLKDEIISKINLQLKKQKITITKLSEICGVSRPTMTKLVNEGIGNINLLEKVYEVLGIEVD